ncbi:MAG: fused MFS/spermidine synthase [Gammaproteobacteria bacterium]|nr:fused MFS/spermidine synthase [Gammaproteobacteria bacterium]
MSGRRPIGTLFWYGTTVFLSSAFLLVLEIVAGRLLAPYVGVSLYTWTSIIGVILAGLSLGNWLGGRIADRGAGEVAVGVTLAVAAAACFAILALLMLVARPLQAMELSLLKTSFVYVAALFFLPAVLLGVVTPLLTTLALRLDVRTGRVVGRMHALAALGSITGTFTTGYWLVQTVGSKTIIIATAIALVLLALPYLRDFRFKGGAALGVIVVIVALVSVTRLVQGFVNPCLKESGYYCLRVVDQFGDEGEARSLVLDHLTHSTNIKHPPDRLMVPYVHAMDELVHHHYPDPRVLRYFFAGGGAYTHPRAVQYRYPNATVTVSELDPVVTEVATSELFFDPRNIRILHGDARVVLSSLADQEFDAVVTDVFHDIAIPYHLTTKEYHQLVKTRLAPHGLYLINVVDVFPDPRLVKAMIKTLAAEFRYVDVWVDHAPSAPTRLTYVVSATNGQPAPNRLRARRGEPRTWYNITDILAATGTKLSDLPALSDDFAPIERLISTLFFSEAGR